MRKQHQKPQDPRHTAAVERRPHSHLGEGHHHIEHGESRSRRHDGAKLQHHPSPESLQPTRGRCDRCSHHDAKRRNEQDRRVVGYPAGDAACLLHVKDVVETLLHGDEHQHDDVHEQHESDDPESPKLRSVNEVENAHEGGAQGDDVGVVSIAEDYHHIGDRRAQDTLDERAVGAEALESADQQRQEGQQAQDGIEGQSRSSVQSVVAHEASHRQPHETQVAVQSRPRTRELAELDSPDLLTQEPRRATECHPV